MFVCAAVLAGSAVMHAMHFVTGFPSDYISRHGDLSTARSVSMAAVPLLLLMALWPAVRFERTYNYLAGRYRAAVIYGKLYMQGYAYKQHRQWL